MNAERAISAPPKVEFGKPFREIGKLLKRSLLDQ
jgi:hypothetical protein